MVLFPKCCGRRAETLGEQKLSVLVDALEAKDELAGEACVKALWRFLKLAVWRPPQSMQGDRLAPGDHKILGLIRATSLETLGVPLVRDGRNGWEFDLEVPVRH